MTNETNPAPRAYQGVMISSTFTDLEQHRQALIRAIKAQGLTDVAMENDSAKSDIDVLDSSLQMVRDSAAYVGVISRKYGQIPKDPGRNPANLSLTELEFDEAQRLKRPVLLLIMGDKHSVTEADVELDAEKRTKLAAFRERAKKMRPDSDVHRVYATFSSLEDFKDHLGPSVAGLKRHVDEQVGRSPEKDSPVAPPSAPSTIPMPTPPAFYAEPPYLGSHTFVGRRAELERLSDWALPTDPHPILLFEAIGGTGKSMLTWEWVTNQAPTVRADWAGRFWYSFYEKGAHLADFCRYALAYITGESLDTFKKMKTLELGERLRHHLQIRPWLFVLDGLERVLVAYHRIDAAQLADEEAGTSDAIGKRDPCSAIRPEDDDLLRILAACKPSKLLVTSRLLPRVLVNSSGQILPSVLHVPLHGLRPPDAEELFRACGVRGDSESIQGYLQKHCDCHPLVTGVLAGLVNDYMSDRGNFDAWQVDPQWGGRLEIADLNLVQKRNHILKAAIAALSPQSRELLSIVAMLSTAVDYSTLSAVLSDRLPTEIRGAITDLENRGLLQYEAQARRYDLHPVVRGVANGGLGSTETERYGQRVVDHFLQQAHNPYEQAETLEDLSAGLHVVRTLLRMGRFEEAYAAYQGDLSNALLFNLEAFAELLALLRPFFSEGWAKPSDRLNSRVQGQLANVAAMALRASGDLDEALAAYGTTVRIALGVESWQSVCTGLTNVSTLFYDRNRLAGMERFRALALDLAALLDNPQLLFKTRLDCYRTLAERGQQTQSEELWRDLNPMGRDWPRATYRPGEAEYKNALARFWQGTLREEDLTNAERLAREGNNRAVTRWLAAVRGEWLFDQGAWQLAADCFQDAVRMAHEVVQTSARSETLLALAKLHLGQIEDPFQEAERLAQARKPFHRRLAELWIAISNEERAKKHALSGYKWAWADGEPYVRRYELNKSRELLERLGVEIPNLPPYDPEKDEKLPWEDEVAAAIERLRAEKEHRKK
ncbi:MAG TPA: DUF4062 domain-containing protein [Thermoanaerobaculia bacterium]|nr:DUF4062 domain-containing protein [Thermoanaerobaculia bacterium]